jgi:hypothetical protein
MSKWQLQRHLLTQARSIIFAVCTCSKRPSFSGNCCFQLEVYGTRFCNRQSNGIIFIDHDVEFGPQIINATHGKPADTWRQASSPEAQTVHIEPQSSVAEDYCLKEAAHSSDKIDCSVTQSILGPDLDNACKSTYI